MRPRALQDCLARRHACVVLTAAVVWDVVKINVGILVALGVIGARGGH